MDRNLKIEQLKEKIANFTDEQFGELLECPVPEKKPERVPPANVHPRLYFTKNRLEKINKNINHDDNKYAYEKYIMLSETECDGVVTDFTDENSMSHMRIVDSNILTVLCAKAFRYALTGDKLYGYEAVAGILSYLSTFDLSKISPGIAHYTSMRIMEKVACVYDWCYDLLSEKDKYRIACGGTSKIHKCMEYNDFPPTGGGYMVGHMCGTIFLIAWASLGIAIYDEYPVYYDTIQNIIVDRLVPTQNFFLSCGEHPAGCAYGPANINSLLAGDAIYSAMFDNKIHLFDSFEKVCLSFLHMIRPDGEMLRIGDDYNEGTRYGALLMTAFWGAYLYNNPVLKGFAKRELNNFSTFYTMSFTPIHLLIFNNPELEAAPLSDLPLVNYNGGHMGSMYARTSWTDPNAVMTYMKIGEAYAGGHQHRDNGSFQIYHKGILASNSGHYGLFNHPIDINYNKQTIACNSILVYNPNMKDTERRVYSGGQRIDDEYSEEVLDIYDWQSKPSFGVGKVLYQGHKITDGKLNYSYLCGDITKAYDKETVSEVKRYMFSLNTGRDDHPLAFFVFDRITALDENYKKTFLLHMQTRPFIAKTSSGKDCAVITNLSSRLYVQTLGTSVNYELIGGEDNQFNVKGVNYSKTRFQDKPFVFNFNVEEGWGRIEISPEKPSKTDCMLNVMYIAPDVDYSPKLVFGESNIMPFNEAVEIKGDGYLGGAILNNAVIFPENGIGFEKEITFTIPANVNHCYVVGVKDGKWSVNGKCEILTENSILDFETDAKEILLKFRD